MCKIQYCEFLTHFWQLGNCAVLLAFNLTSSWHPPGVSPRGPQEAIKQEGDFCQQYRY